MKKKIVTVVAFVLLCAALFSMVGCTSSNTVKMLDGRWQLSSSGNSARENMVEPDIPVYVDIFPDGHVTMFEVDLGTYKISRNTFTFESYDGKYNYSGSFVLQYPDLYIYLDNADECHYFYKAYDHNPDGSLKQN